MAWILFTLASALANSSWVALSQRSVRVYSSTWFTLYFHVLVSVWLVPDFLFAVSQGGWQGIWQLGYRFWGGVLITGATQAIGIWLLGFGVKRDYYTAFALSNTAPILVMFLAPLAAVLVPGFPPEHWGRGTVPGTFLIVAAVLILAQGHNDRRAVVWGALAALAFAVYNLATRWGLTGSQTPDNSRWISHAFNAPQALAGALALVLINAGEILRQGAAKGQSAVTPVDNRAALRNLMLASLVAAFSTIVFNLAYLCAPSATQPCSLVRVNVVFGFLIGFWLLGERDRAPIRAVSSVLILAGAVLVSL